MKQMVADDTPTPPAEQEDTPKRWKKQRHPEHPKENKWVGNPGYVTKGARPFPDPEALRGWIDDMTDWSLMMHDEMIELTRRVRKLEQQLAAKE